MGKNLIEKLFYSSANTKTVFMEDSENARILPEAKEETS